jgi:hypothetical protein
MLKKTYLPELRKKHNAVKRLGMLAIRDQRLISRTGIVRMHAIMTLEMVLRDWIREVEGK